MTTLARRATLAASLLVLAGCGTPMIDTGKVETEVAKGITAQTKIAIRSVQCPDKVEQKQGNDFTCTATDTKGNKAPVAVTQTNAKGSVRWRLGK